MAQHTDERPSPVVVVGVDGSACSQAALRWGLAQAELTIRVDEGHPVQVLMDAARTAHLLVLGSRGHGTFTGILLGSVSQHCVQHAPCPVVVIPQPRPA